MRAGYTPFAFDVTNALNADGDNVLAVRVDNIPWGSREDIIPWDHWTDWFNYTGIIHDVYIEITDLTSIIRTNVVPLNTSGNIKTTLTMYNRNSNAKLLSVSVEVFDALVNEANIQSEKASDIIGGSGVVASQNFGTFMDPNSTRVIVTYLNIPNPRLWFPKTPNLYVMKVTLSDAQTMAILDEYYTQFGVRTITTPNRRTYLNSKICFLTGMARHEDHPQYGRSIPINIIYTDLLKIRDNLHSNLLRTAHYPNHLYTYLIADRLGIAIMEEIPVYWFFDNQWSAQSVRHIHEQMFREMVFKDYNRPSIIMWSTCNESGGNGRQSYIDAVKNDLLSNYPDGRLIGQSASAKGPGANDETQNSCNFAGWTMYFGIYSCQDHPDECCDPSSTGCSGCSGPGTGSVCNLYQYYSRTKWFVESAHQYSPNRPILNTEFGYGYVPIGSWYYQQVQDTAFRETFKVFQEKAPINQDGTFNHCGYVMGCTYWTAFDWWANYRGDSNGLYTMDRISSKFAAQTVSDSYLPYYNLGGVIDPPIINCPEEDELNRQATDANLPKKFALLQNFPNPFNPVTKIKYELPEDIRVVIKIYDLLGKEVMTLVDEFKRAGYYEAVFDGEGFASGVYFYKIEAGGFIESKKMLILK